MDPQSANEPFHFSAVASHGHRTADESMVQETRREVQRLVREASKLVEASESPDQFWPGFLDRVHRAMAAEAALVWKIEDGIVARWHGSGTVFLDELDSTAADQHIRLLDEIACRGEPVLVPPQEPAADLAAGNPTPMLAVLVPILICQRCEALLEIMMPTGVGPATQRGYLRFAAQMGDLAGEFLRSDALRAARIGEQAWMRLQTGIDRLHESLDPLDAAAAVVDRAIEAFDVDRVTLLQRREQQWSVVAVSGIADVDRRSPTIIAIESYVSRRAAEDLQEPWTAAQIDPEDLPVVGFLSIDDGFLILVQSVHGSIPTWQRKHWFSYAAHASSALTNAEQYSAIPWAKQQGQLFAGGRQRTRSKRAWTVAAGITCLAALMSLIPVPMTVSAPAVLNARDVQTVYATRDAVVAKVFVDHGTVVQRGEPLVRLQDDQLDRDIDALVGSIAVLEQERSELRSSMVRDREGAAAFAETESRFKIVEQKLAATKQELQVLEQLRRQLTICAQRNGIVHGWGMQESLPDRPVRRGQELIRVIDEQGAWVLDAEIPQDRLNHVLDLSQELRDLPIEVVFRAFPNQPVAGRFNQMGLIASGDNGDLPTGRAEILVATHRLPIRQSGATATVAIPCGLTPIGYVAFQDLIRAVTSAAHVYF